MFDQYYASTPDVHVHNNIKMNPHDAADAARLYGELERKARAEVAEGVASTFGVDNEVRAVIINQSYDYSNLETQVRLIFKINGKTFDIKCKNDPLTIRRDIYTCMLHEVFDQALEKMSWADKQTLLKPIK